MPADRMPVELYVVLDRSCPKEDVVIMNQSGGDDLIPRVIDEREGAMGDIRGVAWHQIFPRYRVGLVHPFELFSDWLPTITTATTSN